MNLTAANLIEKLKLEPLNEEGGYFRRTVALLGGEAARPEVTSILYLMTKENFARWHRLDCNEIYTYHAGASAEIFTIDEATGIFKRTLLGLEHSLLQYLVPRGLWQAARPLESHGEFTLLGTLCSPGYEEAGREFPTLQQVETWQRANDAEPIAHFAGRSV